MKNLLQLKKEAIKRVESRKKIDQATELKKCILSEIAGDRDRYLAYKEEYENNSGYGGIGISVSVSAVVIAVISIILSLGVVYPDYNVDLYPVDTGFAGTLNYIRGDASPQIIMCSVILLFVVFLAGTSIKILRRVENYKIMGLILDEINKDWDKLFS